MTFRDTLYHANQVVDAAYEAAFRDAQIALTPQQFAVLRAIGGLDGPSQNGLVAVTNIDRSTMADIVLRLVKKGFVERRRNRRDMRGYVLALTTSGKEVNLRAQVVSTNIEAAIPAEGIETKLKAVIASVGAQPALVAAE
jgi:DNA-binding MarR family transcriptional regulator